MEDLPLRVTDDGYTVVDSRNGRIVHCATKWQDIQAFKDRLTDTLLGSEEKRDRPPLTTCRGML